MSVISRVGRVLAASLLALLVIALPATPAGAVEELAIRKVDTTDFPQVRVSVLFNGPKPDATAISVRENGKIVPGLKVIPVEETATPVGVVLVIDTSGSMKSGGRLEQAKTAARAFVERRLANDQIALVTFSNEARVAVNFTSDPGPLLTAIDSLQPAGETALWDGVRVASNLLVDRPDVLPYIVVLSDGADTVSQASAADALGAVQGAKAAVFSVAITGPGDSDVPALKSLADQTGGQFFETSDAKRLSTLYENLQRVLQNQFELRWTSTATASPVELTVQVANSLATASVPVNSVGTGSSASPRVVHAPAVPGPLKGRDGPIVLAGLAGIAAAAIGASVVLLRRPPAAIDQVLRAYSGSALEPVRPDAADRSFVPEAFRRAVETTARLTGGGGALERLDTKLDQADLKLRAQEAVLFYGAGVLLFSLIALVAAGPLIGLAALVLVALVPIALLNQLAEMRRSKFSNQLPDTLQLLASSLRAGYSLLQGLDAVSQEVTDPMGRELRRVVLETRLGRDMEASLGELAGRMKSQDFDWVVMAIRIQREVGGNLAELLSSVSETMISRERLRREVSALTAEGRLSMFIVAGLPIVIGMAIAVLNPGYLNLLFTTTLGKVMVLGSVVLMIFGFIWMKKTIAIEV